MAEKTTPNYSFLEQMFLDKRKMFERIAYFAIGDEEEAKDIVSKCFMQLWLHKGTLVQEEAVSYMFISVRNACMDYRRSDTLHKKIYEEIHKKERSAMEYYSAAIESCDPKEIFKDEILHIARNTIMRLPERQRKIFLMNRVEGLTYKEIAAELGISYKNVDKAIYKTLKELKSSLKEYLPLFLLMLNMDFLSRMK